MTLKRTIWVALAGIVVAVGVAQAGWFFQSGRWYYTPDIGSEVTIKGLPNPEAQPSKVVWTITTDLYGCACRNKGGNFASEVVSLENVQVGGLTDIDPSFLVDKKKGIAVVPGHVDTEELCSPETVTCQNPNWTPDPNFNLVYKFKGTAEAFLLNSKGVYVSQGKQTYTCELSDPNATALNPPAPGTPYNCF